MRIPLVFLEESWAHLAAPKRQAFHTIVASVEGDDTTDRENACCNGRPRNGGADHAAAANTEAKELAVCRAVVGIQHIDVSPGRINDEVCEVGRSTNDSIWADGGQDPARADREARYALGRRGVRDVQMGSRGIQAVSATVLILRMHTGDSPSLSSATDSYAL